MSIIRDRIERFLGIAILLCAASGLTLLLVRFNLQSKSIVWQSLRNFGHMPLFGLIAIIMLWLLRLSLGKRIDISTQYVMAWIGAVGIGVMFEYLQISTHRDADFMDWIFDIAGATSFLGLHLTIDPWLASRSNKLHNRHAIIVRVVALLIMSAVAIPVIVSCYAQMNKKKIFSVLYTFDSHFEKKYLKTRNVDLNITRPPSEWVGWETMVAEIVFSPSTYPTLHCNGPYPDWTGYRALLVDIFSPADEPLMLQVTIKDNGQAQYHDRYNGRFEIQPGYQRLEIPLFEIANAPATRTLDLSSIMEICLFLAEPEVTVMLYLDNLQLE